MVRTKSKAVHRQTKFVNIMLKTIQRVADGQLTYEKAAQILLDEDNNKDYTLITTVMEEMKKNKQIKKT